MVIELNPVAVGVAFFVWLFAFLAVRHLCGRPAPVTLSVMAVLLIFGVAAQANANNAVPTPPTGPATVFGADTS